MSAAYRDHLGPWAGLGSSSSSSINKTNGDTDEHDEAPLLLQKARYPHRFGSDFRCSDAHPSYAVVPGSW